MNVEHLFATIYPGLVRFLYRRIGDHDRAEDLAQEAFVRMLRARPHNPEGWLFVVAANLARDDARRDIRATRRMVLLRASAEEHEAPAAEQQLESDEQVAAVRTALDCLSERDRTLLLLHQEGLSYVQLAEMISVSPTSIAPLLARARGRLLRALQTLPKEILDDRASA